MASPTTDELRNRYRLHSDEALLEAYALGSSSYSPEAWQVISAEVAERGLTPAPPPVEAAPPVLPAADLAHAPADTVAAVVEALNRGVAAEVIYQQLVTQGLSRPDAALVVEKTVSEWLRDAETAAAKALLAGGLWCAGGLGATLLSYLVASEQGGYYVVAYGAVLYGGARLFLGFRHLGALKDQCDLAAVSGSTNAG